MTDRPPVSISLPPDLARYVDSQIKSGKFLSASDVVCEGLRLLEQRELDFAQLRADIELGYQQIERGETVPAEQVFEEIRQMSAARRAQSK